MNPGYYIDSFSDIAIVYPNNNIDIYMSGLDIDGNNVWVTYHYNVEMFFDDFIFLSPL